MGTPIGMEQRLASPDSAPRPSGEPPVSDLRTTRAWKANLMAFMAAAVTLLVQVLVHRVIAAKLSNNFAFLVIALSMLGFAFSGVVLSRTFPFVDRNVRDVISLCASLFVLALIGSTAFFYRADLEWGLPPPRELFLHAFLNRLPAALPFAIPFAFSGFILGTLLSSADLSVRRIYCSDLTGSALGALVAIPAISRLGVERSLLAACATLLGSAVVCFWPRARIVRIVCAGAMITVIGSAADMSVAFRMRFPKGTQLAPTSDPGSGWVLEQVLWDPVSRIEVASIPPISGNVGFPSLLGPSAALREHARKIITQNNFAFTIGLAYDGAPESLRGIEDTIYASAYQATSVANPRVLTIGVGGGFDILTAIRFQAASVTGVEINAATVKILREIDHDYFKSWVDDPRVSLIQAEGRHYLSRVHTSYDILQLSGVDSYTGTPGAAHVFSENYLYTAEAFDLYIARLTPEGILNVMRLETHPPAEMFRALVTAVGALRRAGVTHPASNVIMVLEKGGNFAALLVKRTPFTADEEARVSDWAKNNPYLTVAASPSDLNTPPENAYKTFLRLDDPRRERIFAMSYPVNIQPVSDDCPFFFRLTRWRDVWSRSSGPTPMLEFTLVALFGLIGVVAIVCIALPLVFFELDHLRTRDAPRYGAYFAGIGIGYLAVEIALIQKFALFLGHPNYALSVVLSALLLSSGVGALFSREFTLWVGGSRFVAYALCFVVLGEHLLVFPYLPFAIAWPFFVRAGLAFVLIAPVGLALGTFFPAGLEQTKEVAPRFASWAWGINGIFSVLSPVLSVAVATTFGTTALLVAALPVYLLATAALPSVGSAASRGSASGAARGELAAARL
jgi:spermidine synthase